MPFEVLNFGSFDEGAFEETAFDITLIEVVIIDLVGEYLTALDIVATIGDMATNSTIGGRGRLFIGENKVLRLELLDAAGAPVNMLGWDIVFDVRVRDAAPGPALLSKTASVVGTYSSTRSSNAQRAFVQLDDSDLDLFHTQPYRFSWKRLDDGAETVLNYGDFLPQKATAP